MPVHHRTVVPLPGWSQVNAALPDIVTICHAAACHNPGTGRAAAEFPQPNHKLCNGIAITVQQICMLPYDKCLCTNCSLCICAVQFTNSAKAGSITAQLQEIYLFLTSYGYSEQQGTFVAYPAMPPHLPRLISRALDVLHLVDQGAASLRLPPCLQYSFSLQNRHQAGYITGNLCFWQQPRLLTKPKMHTNFISSAADRSAVCILIKHRSLWHTTGSAATTAMPLSAAAAILSTALALTAAYGQVACTQAGTGATSMIPTQPAAGAWCIYMEASAACTRSKSCAIRQFGISCFRLP